MKKVSIIVPVFQVEKYLKECIDSLISQTLKDIEIILIDDGSTDDSLRICEDYKSKYDNIILIHQENKGLSYTRNVGIRISKGKYIAFCDSDDTYKKDMLEKLYNTAELYETDIVMCGYETFPNKRISLPKITTEKLISNIEFINSYNKMHSDNQLCFSWRFLINSKFLKNKDIVFNENILIGEDFLFNLEIIMQAKKIYVLNEALYNYRTNNSNSIMNKYNPNLVEDVNAQYLEKLRITKKYKLDKNKYWNMDMAYYYITRFHSMLLHNVMISPTKCDKISDINKVINSKAIKNNFKLKAMFADGFKYGIFCIICKLKFTRLIYLILLKKYNRRDN